MNLVEIEKHKNNITKKHNQLLKAKGDLNSTAQKMLAMIISMLRTDDTEFQKYALSIESYKREIGANNNEKDFYVEQAKELMRNPFCITENGKRKFLNWCITVEPDEIDGYIIFDIHKDLKPYLLGLKTNFTQYNIINILQLRGDYTPRLYEYFTFRFNSYKAEYFKKHKKYPAKYTFALELEEFKELIGLIYYDFKKKKQEKKYLFADIKKRILDKAQEQMKKNTDLKFDYDTKKLGRKVTDLIFTIKENNKGSNDYLSSLQAFIKYMRKEFINEDILKANHKVTNAVMEISIKPDGTLYDKQNIADINKNRSKEMWDKLYNLACENKLLCLKQGQFTYED